MTQDRPSLLQVQELSIAFTLENQELTAVDKISFDIKPDECLGLVGESGCGKSVTAMSLLRLLPQPSGRITNGTILFDGKDLNKLSLKELQGIRGGDIAMIFQDPMQALNPVQCIGEQIMESLTLHQGLQGEKAKKAAIAYLKQVQFPSAEQRWSSYPHQLSGGQRQRVLIAQALAGKPRLIIADEPTTALDVTVQQQILELLQEQRNCAMMLITHDLGLVAQYCQRVAVMYAGRIVEIAPVVELFDHPAHAYTKALLASRPQANHQHKAPLPTIPGQICAIEEYASGCRFCQRMGRTESSKQARPSMVEISPQHWVEACAICAPTSQA